MWNGPSSVALVGDREPVPGIVVGDVTAEDAVAVIGDDAGAVGVRHDSSTTSPSERTRQIPMPVFLRTSFSTTSALQKSRTIAFAARTTRLPSMRPLARQTMPSPVRSSSRFSRTSVNGAKATIPETESEIEFRSIRFD